MKSCVPHAVVFVVALNILAHARPMSTPILLTSIQGERIIPEVNYTSSPASVHSNITAEDNLEGFTSEIDHNRTGLRRRSGFPLLFAIDHANAQLRNTAQQYYHSLDYSDALDDRYYKEIINETLPVPPTNMTGNDLLKDLESMKYTMCLKEADSESDVSGCLSAPCDVTSSLVSQSTQCLIHQIRNVLMIRGASIPSLALSGRQETNIWNVLYLTKQILSMSQNPMSSKSENASEKSPGIVFG